MKQNDTTKTEAQKALLYCRVSSAKQREEGHGLDSQEHRCRQYAAMQGYMVEQVFPDDVSGGGDFMNRPGMVALLAYLDEHDDENYVVIFDDLKRFARDREFHFKLRGALAMRGAEVECLNFRFEDTPEGEFIETVFAAQGQLERLQNARQTKQKMRARVDKGYFIFGTAPLGYAYEKQPDGGKMLAPVEPNASIMKEALEGFACGRFQSAAEVQRFLESFPSTARNNSRGGIHLQSVHTLMRSPIYAGYMTIKKWNIHLKPARHKALISFATWQKVQERLDGISVAPARKDFNEDFPLRGCIECDSCGHPMTAAWAKGRNALYPYYFCQNKGCTECRKSIRKEKVEGDFEAFLKALQPAPCLFQMAYAMMADRWNAVMEGLGARAADAKAEIAKLEKKTAKLVGLVLDADSPALITAYEGQIRKLEERKALLKENAAKSCVRPASFEETYRTACAFLANPWKLWDSGNLEYRRLVLL